MFRPEIQSLTSLISFLTLGQIHSALAYYFDHQDEVNSDLEEAGNVEYWKIQVQSPLARQ